MVRITINASIEDCVWEVTRSVVFGEGRYYLVRGPVNAGWGERRMEHLRRMKIADNRQLGMEKMSHLRRILGTSNMKKKLKHEVLRRRAS